MIKFQKRKNKTSDEKGKRKYRAIYFAKYHGQERGKKMVLGKKMKTEAMRKGKGEEKKKKR